MVLLSEKHGLDCDSTTKKAKRLSGRFLFVRKETEMHHYLSVYVEKGVRYAEAWFR